jgi:hypothetical protein
MHYSMFWQDVPRLKQFQGPALLAQAKKETPTIDIFLYYVFLIWKSSIAQVQSRINQSGHFSKC